jgi:hypothetical protein
VWNNSPADFFGFSDPTGSDGNLSQDPEFCDPVSENYHLDPSSPCAPLNSPGSCALIGALGVGCGVVAVDPADSAGGFVTLYQNVPNPARDRAHIRYRLSQASRVRLAVYDVEGRLVRVAHEGRMQPAGEYEWIWDGRDGSGGRMTSGVYFYTLQAAGYIDSRKLILLD